MVASISATVRGTQVKTRQPSFVITTWAQSQVLSPTNFLIKAKDLKITKDPKI